MPTKKQQSYVNYSSASPVPANISMPAISGEVLIGDLPLEQQQHISRETGIELAIIKAMKLKSLFARYVVQEGGLDTLERVNEFLALSRPLLDKERPKEDQAQFQKAYENVLTATTNALIAINASTNNAVTTIAARPISRPKDPEPKEYVSIERAPGFFGFLSGDLIKTTMRR
jgi:hypothetical protein